MTSFPPWAWLVFGMIVLGLQALDLFAHRGAREESHPRALVWSSLWIVTGLAFAVIVGLVEGGEGVKEYLAAYLLEESLSLDNLFVFLIIFQSLNISQQYQRTALSWGIFGALVFRAIFIFAGVAVLKHWQWVEYVFGAILLYAAYHALREDPKKPRENKMVSWLSCHFPVTKKTDTSRFIVQEGGQWMVTPLLIAVLTLECTDIMFAMDSVPAALSVSRREFIVYSSNVFAILGLRSLYMVLAKTLVELAYLHYGLAAVLAFAGLKMLLASWVEIPPLMSVGVIVGIVGAAVWASIRTQTPSAQSKLREDG